MRHLQRAIPLGFIAGALSIVAFHQGTVFLLFHVLRLVPNHGFDMAPMPPWGIPTLFLLIFAGGLLGIVLALLLRVTPVPDLAFGAVFGLVVGCLLVWEAVPYLRGLPGFQGWWVPGRMWREALLNAGWGFGAAFLLRPLSIRG